MSLPAAITWNRGRHLPWRRRLAVRAAVALAVLLARLPPAGIRRVLGVVRRGARTATYEQAQAAYQAVTATSLRCAGREGCLPRSIAVTVLCRMSGTWPTWCAGVRFQPPFAAHAWVEAGGRIAGEPLAPDYYRALVTVPPP